MKTLSPMAKLVTAVRVAVVAPAETAPFRVVLPYWAPELQTAAWAQLGRVLAYSNNTSGALNAWGRASEAAAPYSGINSVEEQKRSVVWHTAMNRWSHADWLEARAPGAYEGFRKMVVG